jgi:hypothetical protein
MNSGIFHPDINRFTMEVIVDVQSCPFSLNYEAKSERISASDWSIVSQELPLSSIALKPHFNDSSDCT